MIEVERRSRFPPIKFYNRKAFDNKRCLLFGSNFALIILFFCSASIISAAESNLPPNSTRQHLMKTQAKTKEMAYIKAEYLDSVDKAYKSEFLLDHAQQNKLSISNVIHSEVIAKIYSFFVADVFLQRYEDQEDLKLSGGPQANQEICLRQLGQLIDRASVLKGEKGKSKDIEMFRLLDAFGRVPAGTLGGEISWLGSYRECLDLRISLDGGRIATRYCASSLKLNDWPDDRELDEYAVLKLAVCLPKSCDSIDYKNKFQLIQQLVEFNSRQVDFGTWNFTYLYCLPDEQSNLRIWWKSPGAVVTVSLAMGWFSLLIFASIQHKKSLTKRKDGIRVKSATPSFGLSSGLKFSLLGAADRSLEEKKRLKLYRALSIFHNSRILFDTKTRSNSSASQNLCQSNNKPIVDFGPLDGIRALCMIYVIIGHGLFINTVLKRNWRDFLTTSSVLRLLFPATAISVNTFFAITGMLTTYFLFKRKSSEEISLMAKPMGWFKHVLYRYLRLMPIYLVLVAYEKYIAVYTGSGPLWDYGTSTESLRRNCRQQSWLWTVLFSTNFASESVLACIPPSWYINNDLQYALITPFILACLGKSEKLGKLVIGLIISASFLISIVSRHIQPALDYRPFAKLLFYALKTNVVTENQMYIQPQHRIPPYLIGLLIGLSLNHYEQKKLKWLEARSKHQNTILQQSNNETTKEELEPDWSTNFRRHLPILFAIGIPASCYAAPSLASYLNPTKMQAQIIATIGVPFVFCSSALIMGLYILLAVTGHGFKRFNKFLSLGFWKPISRLSLCALLINFEVIVFLSGRTTHMEYFDAQFQLVVSIFIVLATYLAAAVLYVLFESPMREIINHLLVLALSRRPSRQHKSSSSPSSSSSSSPSPSSSSSSSTQV